MLFTLNNVVRDIIVFAVGIKHTKAETGFKKFLDEKIDVPKSEYYLPAVVSERIENGEKSVKVLIAEDKWYGVTYKEDKQVVVDAIGKMVTDGLYEGL